MTAIEFQYKLIDMQRSLMRFAYSLTTNIDNAQDLVQDTFLNAIKYRDKFAPDTNFKAWTFTILKNIFINKYRREQFHNAYNNQTIDGLFLNSAQTIDSISPDSVFIAKELERAIETLEDNFRLPFKMQHEGYKYKEIAETLDLNIGTVKSRIFFARKKLIKHLGS
jgi:RNA polymerase sigma-70 factor (ECF subfamily)